MSKREFGSQVWIVRCFYLTRPKAILRRKLLQIIALIVPILGIPTGGRPSRAKVIRAIEMPFSYIGRFNAAIVQPLTDCVNCLSERKAICPSAVAMRITSCKKGRARRRAHWLTSIGARETHTSRGDAVKIGRFESRLPIAVQHIPAHGVGDENDSVPMSAR